MSLFLPYIFPYHLLLSFPTFTTSYRAFTSRSMHTLDMIISCSTIAVDKSRLHISAAFTQTQTHTHTLQTCKQRAPLAHPHSPHTHTHIHRQGLRYGNTNTQLNGKCKQKAARGAAESATRGWCWDAPTGCHPHIHTHIYICI